MKNVIISVVLVLVGLALLWVLLYSQNGPPKFDISQLNGEWVIANAIRDHKETHTLDGLIFSFDENELTSNISGELKTESIVVKNPKIEVDGQNRIYEITYLDEHRLVLTTKVRDSNYVFTFDREGQ